MRWYIDSRGRAFNLDLFFKFEAYSTDSVAGSILIAETPYRNREVLQVKEVVIENKIPSGMAPEFIEWLLRDYSATRTLLRWKEFSSQILGKP